MRIAQFDHGDIVASSGSIGQQLQNRGRGQYQERVLVYQLNKPSLTLGSLKRYSQYAKLPSPISILPSKQVSTRYKTHQAGTAPRDDHDGMNKQLVAALIEGYSPHAFGPSNVETRG